jgi:hypothetical protein
MLKLRLLLYPLFLTVILLMVFANIATPVLQRRHAFYILPVHKTLYLGHSIYDNEMYHVIAAAIEWNQATNGQVIFDIKVLPQQGINRSEAVIINNVTPDFPEVILLDNVNDQMSLGYFDDHDLDNINLVDERIMEKDYNAVIMHELGHSLGMDHIKGIDGIGTLMYPSIDHGSEHITNTDLYYFCKLYHCDSRKFNGVNKISQNFTFRME